MPRDDDEIQTTLADLTEELLMLVQSGAEHADHLHETEAARRDKGGMQFCPGCRMQVVSKAVARLAEGRGDVTPSRIRRDRKSRQERALEHARSVRGEGRKDSRGVM